MGAESLSKMKEQVKERIRRDFTGVSRLKAKRALLDALDEELKFQAPQSLVDQEYETVWKSVENDMSRRNVTFADEETTEEEAKAEYRRIADRRVRLGLAIAELGEKNNIQVTDDEITRAIVEQARQFPGQEQQVWEHFRNNPQALAGIRAPLFEDKVIDYILELADVTRQQGRSRDIACGRRRRQPRPAARSVSRRKRQKARKPINPSNEPVG